MPATHTCSSRPRTTSATIQRTIRSVLEQSSLPARWVIVSDGSTDGTDEIVRKHAEECDFIRMVLVSRPGGHSFKHKVEAIHRSDSELCDIAYDYFGVLDA
ncbi:MAG: glycosyltransferase family 2 protein, partial [Deltaproteobacteria bacterium]|nr:glycosyltransferase family 2 protein [Deltaproteobacteria bacterium]